MPQFSKASAQRLATCHIDIRKVCEQLIKTYDFSVVCGYRDQPAQEDAYKAGKSKVRFPHSAHNKRPSLAVDLVPYPVDWRDIGRFKELAAAFMAVAKLMYEQGMIQSQFTWGGNWQTFPDYPHYEIKEV